MVVGFLRCYVSNDGLQVEAQKREREGTAWSEEEQAAFKAKIAERCQPYDSAKELPFYCRSLCSACGSAAAW